MTVTGSCIFSGGEGVGIGMRQAGIEHLWSIEYDADIAGVAEANGFRTIVADVCAVDPSTLLRPNILHASPVCKNASVAKSNRGEAQEDIDTARAVCRFISALRPDVFTLENVIGYRKFKAFEEILECLKQAGYKVGWWHLNSASYGVPQTRKRLILVARLNGKPRRPHPTHCKNPTPMLGLKRWVGWYEAIEDLIPTLPESRFAEWQLKRLPKELGENTLFNNHFGDADGESVNAVGLDDPAQSITALNPMRAFVMQVQGAGGDGLRTPDEPMQVVAGQHSAGKYRAFIVDATASRNYEGGHVTVREAEEPVNTVKGVGLRMPRAFIASPTNGNGLTLREGDEPAHVVTGGEGRKPTRAFIVGGANTSDEQAAPGVGVSEMDEPTRVVAGNSLSWKAMLVDSAGYNGQVVMRPDDGPAGSIVANYAVRKLNAFLVDDQNNGSPNGNGERGLTIRDSDEPSHTISATQTKRALRAWLSLGRVVAMTPRCLARFQSFPDDYALPKSNRLASTVIGNAVPPLLYRRVIEANLDGLVQ